MSESYSNGDIEPQVKGVTPQENSGKENQKPPVGPTGPSIPPARPRKNDTEHCRPDQTPWWKHLMELAAILVGVAVAIIYYHQLVAMQGQLNQMEGSGKQTQQLIDAANIQAGAATSFSASADGINTQTKHAVDKFDRMAKASESASRAAARSAAQSERNAQAALEAAKVEQRAWVGIVKQDTSGYDPKTGRRRVLLVFTNTGRTPALKTDICGWSRVPLDTTEHEPPFDQDCTTHEEFLKGEVAKTEGGGIVFPGELFDTPYETQPITAITSAMIDAGKEPWFIYGAVWYDDVYNCHHWMKFCLSYHADTQRWGRCVHHNELDENKCSQ